MGQTPDSRHFSLSLDPSTRSVRAAGQRALADRRSTVLRGLWPRFYSDSAQLHSGVTQRKPLRTASAFVMDAIQRSALIHGRRNVCGWPVEIGTNARPALLAVLITVGACDPG